MGNTSIARRTIPFSRFSDFDIYLFKQGKHYRLYEKLGAHVMEHQGQRGTYFAVWAPNAKYVSVVGDFNLWDRGECPLYLRQDDSGIWEGFVFEAGKGNVYKYYIESNYNNFRVEKSDPFAFQCEIPPATASVVCNTDFNWNDEHWMEQRKGADVMRQPYSVYEMHIGSWKRVPEENNRSLTYRELAEQLPQYLTAMNYTHVEFLPVMEHPFYGSWGYQIANFFAPTSRYGSSSDFMHLIDALHKAGIGVILDWVPSHFPGDEHGLVYFDGTHLFEHADPRKGFHPDWNSYIFNYGRNEVRSFLISNACFWLDRYHIDGLRVDAVASMLYLNYSRKDGEWIPNEFGGNENLEAISLLREFNEVVYSQFPGIFTVAEESTAFPGVSHPTFSGGLGFGMKWAMGWMHDSLQYVSRQPDWRPYHKDQISFSILYFFSENFILPLSHDEVVYGKGSILRKMPGDEWQRFANLRLLYAYMYGHPGGKLLFMGNELAQYNEWNHDSSLDWHLLNYQNHRCIKDLICDLNFLYQKERALHEQQFSGEGFEWIDVHSKWNGVISFLRKAANSGEMILVCCNFTLQPFMGYEVNVPSQKNWKEILNTDDPKYGGSGVINKEVQTQNNNGSQSLKFNLPPAGTVFLKSQ